MMAQKHLHELLQEDQEPFLLKNYIADRRCQLKRASPRTHLQVKKRKPICQQQNSNSNFRSNFCKNACFFSFHDSPDPRKSPLFDYQSPVKSPSKSPNTIFLHIPARTAAILLEAALRIQKQSSSPKNRTQNKGLFGSFLKRLTLRSNNKNRKREICGEGVKVSVKDILRWDSSVGRRKSHSSEKNINEQVQEAVLVVEEKSACEIGFSSCSCNGRPSSAVWSESNEEKSLDFDLETSSSSQSEYFEELTDFASCEKHFCESPFRFVLQRSPSPGRRTPDFSSPASSPARPNKKDKENYEVESLKKLQQEEDEVEKEQCSPVSVLDPPFEDDDDGHYNEVNEEDDDGFDIESSFAIVQRAKQQLLHKLRRFEKLAGLDPIELEKRMSEQLQDDDDVGDNNSYDLEEEESVIEDQESISLDREKNVADFVKEVLCKSSFHHLRQIPEGMKRLVSDLIAEEQGDQNCFVDTEVLVKRVCKRLESWKEVEFNTIDMMVEQDFKSEVYEWKRNQEQVGEMAMEIELAIFGLLMEELSQELVCFAGN